MSDWFLLLAGGVGFSAGASLMGLFYGSLFDRLLRFLEDMDVVEEVRE